MLGHVICHSQFRQCIEISRLQGRHGIGSRKAGCASKAFVELSPPFAYLVTNADVEAASTREGCTLISSPLLHAMLALSLSFGCTMQAAWPPRKERSLYHHLPSPLLPGFPAWSCSFLYSNQSPAPTALCFATAMSHSSQIRDVSAFRAAET